MFAIRVFAKTLSHYGGKKEHGVDTDLLDHYHYEIMNNPAYVLKVAKEQKFLRANILTVICESSVT